MECENHSISNVCVVVESIISNYSGLLIQSGCSRAGHQVYLMMRLCTWPVGIIKMNVA